jgi:hypothetical protein
MSIRGRTARGDVAPTGSVVDLVPMALVRQHRRFEIDFLQNQVR